MSLYTWLSAEGRCHFNTEMDCSNPRPIDYSINPPTFITYHVTQNTDIDKEVLKKLIKNYLDENDPEMINIITEKVANNLKNNISKTIEEVIEETFKEISEEQLVNILEEEKNN